MRAARAFSRDCEGTNVTVPEPGSGWYGVTGDSVTAQRAGTQRRERAWYGVTGDSVTVGVTGGSDLRSVLGGFVYGQVVVASSGVEDWSECGELDSDCQDIHVIDGSTGRRWLTVPCDRGDRGQRRWGVPAREMGSLLADRPLVIGLVGSDALGPLH